MKIKIPTIYNDITNEFQPIIELLEARPCPHYLNYLHHIKSRKETKEKIKKYNKIYPTE